ncbi:hypothetical protein [Candidatus Protochlamydia amoebophila]|uniref:Uncharacterized protein n=1 Tax=Candidatus Protochlamydia amoebophila TaxID=362787 RepID=A0A0C1H5X5_9BACT|nr:hypothetical protein [Candidatus Protochlamydia amoebophila]KIC72879.1 hypothetical protein DB44_BY00020 [Candidatus Protochlamydia amoebophila]
MADTALPGKKIFRQEGASYLMQKFGVKEVLELLSNTDPKTIDFKQEEASLNQQLKEVCGG